MLCDFFGVEQQYQENYLSKYYNKLGHEVVIIASTIDQIQDYYNNNYLIKSKSISCFGKTKLIRLPYQINIAGKLRRFKGVKKILLEESPDFIYVHGTHNLNLNDAAWYKSKYNTSCRIICDSHADFSNSGVNWMSLYILNGFFRRYYFQCYKHCLEKIYAVSPDGIDFLNKIYGISYSEIELLPLGCDYELSNEIKQRVEKEHLRSTIGIENDDFVIFTGGQLNKNKKTELLIQAIVEINRPDVFLLIVGQGDVNNKTYENALKEKAQGHRVFFTGWLKSDKILEWMGISNLAVFPGSQSVLWQQAIGMHLPLIVGNIGNQDAGYLNVNDNVVVIQPEDITVKRLSEEIEKLIISTKELDRMRLGAQKTAEQFLDYKIIAEKTISK